MRNFLESTGDRHSVCPVVCYTSWRGHIGPCLSVSRPGGGGSPGGKGLKAGPHVITGEYLNTWVEYSVFGVLMIVSTSTHDCEYNGDIVLVKLKYNFSTIYFSETV
jgi:hypothetical protein